MKNRKREELFTHGDPILKVNPPLLQGGKLADHFVKAAPVLVVWKIIILILTTRLTQVMSNQSSDNFRGERAVSEKVWICRVLLLLGQNVSAEVAASQAWS